MYFFKRILAPTFKDFADEWIKKEYARYAPISAPKQRRLLEKSVYPFIGHKKIIGIKQQDIVDVVLNYRKTAPNSAKKMAQILYRIFVYANVVGGYKIENPVKKEELKILYAYSEIKGGEFAVLPIPELPTFFEKIDNIRVKKPETKTAFWLLAYTALRRSEVMRASWEEIDFKNRMWAIPQKRMKMRHSVHIIPLVPQVIDLLILLQKQTGRQSGKLFEIDPATPLRLCGATGYKNRMTLHGLRKVFSTHAHESRLWTIDAIELQLSHLIPGVRGVYNKALYIDERRQLMCWYAKEIDRWRFGFQM